MDKFGMLVRMVSLAAAEEALKIAVLQAGGKLVLTPEMREKADDCKVVGHAGEDGTYTLTAEPVGDGEQARFYPDLIEGAGDPTPEEAA